VEVVELVMTVLVVAMEMAAMARMVTAAMT